MNRNFFSWIYIKYFDKIKNIFVSTNGKYDKKQKKTSQKYFVRFLLFAYFGYFFFSG